MKVGWVAKKAHTFSARMLPNAESQQAIIGGYAEMVNKHNP